MCAKQAFHEHVQQVKTSRDNDNQKKKQSPFAKWLKNQMGGLPMYLHASSQNFKNL